MSLLVTLLVLLATTALLAWAWRRGCFAVPRRCA